MRHTYETKCRRCGKIYEWSFGPVSVITYEDFLISMNSKLEKPSIYDCGECKKYTIQDIVSYSLMPETDERLWINPQLELPKESGNYTCRNWFYDGNRWLENQYYFDVSKEKFYFAGRQVLIEHWEKV